MLLKLTNNSSSSNEEFKRYLILINIDSDDFFLSYFSLVLVSIQRVFDHISKRLEIRQKYSATPRIFNCLRGLSC